MNQKSGETWAYRRWLLQSHPLNLTHELARCSLFAERYLKVCDP